jgi:hypothetical protein
MTKDTDKFEGKTIKSVKQQAINCWVFEFTDGTQRVIWAEIDGPMNLGQLWTSKTL